MIPGFSSLVGIRKAPYGNPSIAASSSGFTNNGSSCVIGAPSGTVNGSFCFLVFMYTSGLGTNSMVNPSGWTRIIYSNDSVNAGVGMSVYYRVVTGAESVVLQTGHAAEIGGYYFRITGQSINSAEATDTVAGSSVINFPNLNHSWMEEYGSLFFALLCRRSPGLGGVSAPSGYTSLYQLQTGTGYFSLWYRVGSSANEDPASISSASVWHSAVTAAIKGS